MTCDSVSRYAYVYADFFVRIPMTLKRGVYVIPYKEKGTVHPHAALSCICLQIFAFSATKQVNFHFKEGNN